MPKQWDRLIVALDVTSKEKIKEVVDVLGPKGVRFKIGSIAFTKFGPDFTKELIDSGKDIFLDLKLYDIPNTMAKTTSIITQMGCWAFTVHLKAGQRTLAEVKAAVSEAARTTGKVAPMVLGVSVLTSSEATSEEINKLVSLADSAGLDGVISSAQDVKAIKQAFPNLKVITPGIRSLEDEAGDQLRVTTASTAFENGSDYIVVGRPIINKQDYLKAAEDILDN